MLVRLKQHLGSGLQLATTSLLLMVAACDQSAPVEDYVKNAQASRAAGDISTAIADLKVALQKNPKDLTARILLAQYYLDLPDPIGAEALLWRAREDGADEIATAKPLAQAELLMGKQQLALKTAELPTSAPAELRASLMAIKGEVYIGLGRGQDAQDALDAGLRLDPHSVDVLATMARYALAVGDVATAQNRLAQARKEAPKDIGLFDLEGAVAFAAQDYTVSTQAYKNLLTQEPWSLNARLGLARAQIAEGKSDDADANLAAVLRVSPTDPRANYLSALIAYRNNDYVKAQTRVQRALNSAKNFSPALLLAGASAYALHQYEQANAFLGQFVYQVPQYAQARKLLAAVQIALGRPADAVKTLAVMVNSEPGDPQLFALIGGASAQIGDFKAADRYLLKALELQPDNAALRTELGIARVALGQTEAGIEVLEDASRQDPSTLRPDIALFIAYFKQKDFDKALEAGRRLEKNYPNEATGFDFTGAAYFAKGDEQAASTAFEKARELRPGDPIATRSLAALAVRAGDTSTAAQFYTELLTANPKDAAAFVSLAELQDQQGRRVEAIATLRKAIEQIPDEPAPRIALGRIYVLDRNYQGALTAVSPVVATGTKNVGLLEIVGRAQLALGDTDGALAAFKQLAEVRPQAGFAHRYLAATYLAAGQLDLALGQANQSVEADPQDPIAKMILARIHIAKGGAEAARKVLDEVATQYPNDAVIAELQGSISLQQNRPEDAAAEFQRVLAADDNAADRMRLAAVQARTGRIDEAEKTLTEWLDVHPDDIAPRETLGDVYLAANRADDAQHQYEAVLARAPDHIAAENNLAWVLFRKGDMRPALDHAQHAASLAPDTPRILDTLGVIYLQNRQIVEAMDSLSKAAQSAPADPEIQFHFAQVLAGAGNTDRARDVLRTLLALNQAFDEREQARNLLQNLGG